MRLTNLMRTKKVILWLIFWFSACIAFSGAAAHADESIKETQTEESKKNQFVTYTPGEGIRIEAADLNITFSVTGIFQGTPNFNGAPEGKFGTSWLGAIGFEKFFDDWGVAWLNVEFGQGNTLNSDLNIFNIVNYDAHDNNARLEAREFWYKQYLFDRQLSILCGKVQQRDYLDLSEYAGDDSTEFIGAIFNRSPVIEWPEYFGPGGQIKMEPRWIDFLEVKLTYFDGAADDWNNIFNDGIYAAQLKIKTPPFLDDGEWGGNYRFYGWTNLRSHTELLNPNRDKEVNYGAGFGFDQSVTDVLGIFGRFGWQRPDLVPADGGLTNGGATIEMSWSGGAQITGEYWNREDDTFGLAAGQLLPSKDYKDAGNPGSTEGHLEAYYSFMVSDHLFVSPDFQLIWNPDGVGDDDNIYVYGTRVYLLF